ncbi:MAG TPA: ABC transporter permease [Puia sp.]|jgi:ABC-type antimicrobial peptide transport system permease subunit|nr:ABC transporter permease [Puia sp.]
MLKNYIKIALRNLFRNKGFSVINISGLAIGMASAILILLWVQNEISYDRFHEKNSRLYEVWENSIYDGALQTGLPTPQLMGPALKNDYPEIESATRVSWNMSILFGYGDKHLKASGIWVDPSFLTMFSFPLLIGDIKTALNDPHSLVITEKMSKKLFGDENPIGKVVKFDNSENFIITGLLKDLPNNTDFDFEFLESATFMESKGYMDADWTDVSIRTFVLLKPNTRLADINSKIKNIVIKYSGGRSKDESFLYPVSQLRLYSKFVDGKPTGGRIETVRLFTLIAVFILLIACINFMNLSTARSEKRAKEVGIRKVAGALKKSLIAQFLIESIIISAIAGFIALIIVQFSLPAFNQLTQKQLFIDYTNFNFWLICIGFVMFTGMLAGSYPAFFLSNFKPVAVLKGTFKKVNALVTPRKILVVSQFTFAIILVISTIIIVQQIKYAQERNSGYDKNNLAYVFIEGDIPKNYQLIKYELINSGTAIAVSQTMAPLTQSWSSGMSLNWQGKDPNTRPTFDRSTTDGGIIKTAGLELVQGRDIDINKYPTDSTACIINESAAKIMNFKNPIGQLVFDDPINWHIVGVIKDFILQSPYDKTRPIIFKGPKYGSNVLNIKFNSRYSTAQNLATAEKIFKKYNPAYPFEYHFIDEEYAKKFSDQQQTGILAGLFAGLTIFISCLGLFGLATYMAESRIKEVGVRKILGASVSNITALLSKDFVKLVVISIFIASPISWYFMKQWLMGFDYRIHISWFVFAMAGLTAIIIALITVSFQAIKAAIANPVTSLRSE